MIKYAKIWWHIPEIRYHVAMYLLARVGYMLMVCISLPLTIPMVICYVLEKVLAAVREFIESIDDFTLRKPTMFFINMRKEHHAKAGEIVPHEEMKKRARY